MAIRSSEDWANEWENVPLVSDQSWKGNIAAYLYDMTSKFDSFAGMVLAAWEPKANIDFQFDSSTFESTLLDSSFDPPNGLENTATAWEAAILTSTLTITPPTSTPATDTIASVIVDPPSIAVGKAAILSTDLTPVSDAKDSDYIVKLRQAFLSLTYTVQASLSGTPTTYPTQTVE